ncbi:MAG: FGGY family carbohydrate kinase, partial [Janthinobacterium lividum]
MSAPGVVMGVDSSTQSCKVELRDSATGALLATGRAPHPVAIGPRSEQEPTEWWAALRIALSTALSNAGMDGCDVAAVSIAAQCHGLVALGAADEVLRPAKLWNDTTSTAALGRLREFIDAPTWARRTGSVPTAAFTIAKIAWLAQHEPHNLRALRTILLPHDYLTFRLTGERVTDRSEASGTGYYDASAHGGRGAYVPDLLELIDPDKDWGSLLPHVLGPSEAAGRILPAVAEELGLRPNTVVAAGGGDQHAAALGLGVEPGDVTFSLGTSGVVFTPSTTPVHDEAGIVDGVADMTGGYLPLVS